MSKSFIKVVAGDNLTVELSPYDLTTAGSPIGTALIHSESDPSLPP